MDQLKIQQIGRYKLLDVIGKGGMGIVWQAVDTTIDRKVAIKMLLGEDSGSENNLLTRFYKEARSTASLQHKNIVTVYALDDFEGHPYMVMEYLEGESIAQLISSRREISLIEKIGLMCQVCEGLQYAHDRSIIHRDIKPGNILVLKDGSAKIVDFGIARVGLNDNLTRTGQIVGSIYYMSPEQTTGVVDSRSDIYAAGVTLFEFITGEVPFKGSDLNGTLLKIANEPAPSLGKYLATFPEALDAILGKALAKDPAARYQTAEDFGYELSQLQENLRRQMIGAYLQQAEEAMKQQQWDTAKQRLQEILRFDRRHAEANELYRAVREQIQLQQRSVQIQQLRSQAEIALTAQQFEEALECIEQAKRLDPNDPSLQEFSKTVQSQYERAKELSDALRRGQAALYAGDLNEANEAVSRALQIDQSNAEARALETLVRKEIGDRAKRSQLQGYLDQARQEITNRNFLVALQILQKAQEVDPSDSNIRELATWAATGHEQEKLRQELRKSTDEISRLIAEDRYAEALSAARTALEKFPNDNPLQKLGELAGRRQKASDRRRAIDEVSINAKALIGAEKSQDAIRLLESALQSFPGDANLQMLLEMTRSQIEQKRLEQEERESQIHKLSQTQSGGAESEDLHRAVLQRITALQTGLDMRLPVARLESLKEEAVEAAERSTLNETELSGLNVAASELASRAGRLKQDAGELVKIEGLIQKATDGIEVDRLFEKATVICGLHTKEDSVIKQVEQIRKVKEEFKDRREAIHRGLSEILRALQCEQSISELKKQEGAAREIAQSWLSDEFIANLLDQITICVSDAVSRRDTVFQELAQLRESLATVRSGRQIRFLLEQEKLLSSEFGDDQVRFSAAAFEKEANQQLSILAENVSRLSELARKATAAETISQLVDLERQANETASDQTGFEEAIEVRKRIQKTLEDRTKEHKRISATLEQLVGLAASAESAELDAVEARQKILRQKYPKETAFSELHTKLESAIGEQRALLSQRAERDQSEEFDQADTGFEEEIGAISRRLAVTGQQSTERVVVEKRRSPWIAVAAGLSVVAVGAAAALFLLPRKVEFHALLNATITVGDQSCLAPCSLRLKPGKYQVTVKMDGYQSAESDFAASLFGPNSVSLSLTPLPTLPLRETSNAAVAAVSNAPGRATIDVRSSVPKATILEDAKPVGTTDRNGYLRLTTSPGPHFLQAQKQGYAPSQQMSVEAATDRAASLTITLQQQTQTSGSGQSPQQVATTTTTTATTTPPLPPTLLAVRAPSNAEIHIDDQVAGHSTGDVLKFQVSPGAHTVEVVLAGYQNYKKAVTVDQGKAADVAVDMQPLPTPPKSNSVASTHTAPTVSDEDAQQIRQVIIQYATAVEHRDSKQLHKIFPDLPKDKEETIKNLTHDHKGVKFDISVLRISPVEGQTTVIVSCKQNLTMDGQQLPEQSILIYMNKTSSGWIITQIPRSN